MTDRVIPLTPPGPLWSQREYVAAMRMGIGFAAHRHGVLNQIFHYAFPDDIGCTSVIVNDIRALRYIDHDFKRDDKWISRCVAAMPKGE